MHVTSLHLQQFRSYGDLTLPLSPGLNIFLGANAQGKTNLLEAIYYASLGRSHRTAKDSDLVSFQAPAGLLQLAFSRAGVKNRLELKIPRKGRRKILLNGEAIPPRALVGELRTVLFSPEDLFLIKGAPQGRRRFLDSEISQASPAYYHELLTYTHLLAQRNALLKRIREDRAPRSLLSSWDPQLSRSAAKITQKRQEAVKKLHMLANLMQRRISGSLENLALSYEIHGRENEADAGGGAHAAKHVTENLELWYNKRLGERQTLDILRAATSVGPHRDDLALRVNGIDLRAYGSQGQQRTGALALKLAELEFLRSETGEYPVLLLDDVMSELDYDRRRALLAFLARERIQTIITATDAAYFPNENFGTVYRVAHGSITLERKEDAPSKAT